MEPSSLSSCTDSRVRGRGGKEEVGRKGWGGLGKKELGDKRCMLVGVVVRGGVGRKGVGRKGVGRKGLGREGRERVGRQEVYAWEVSFWCSSCVEPSSLSSCTDSRVRGRGGKEGEGGVGREGGKDKKLLGDKRCMLEGVVVLVFIMCGAVIAIFMHRFTGNGEGWGGVEEGSEFGKYLGYVKSRCCSCSVNVLKLSSK